jgi:hypothetical protein
MAMIRNPRHQFAGLHTGFCAQPGSDCEGFGINPYPVEVDKDSISLKPESE